MISEVDAPAGDSVITWNRSKLKKFKKAYALYSTGGPDFVFTFDGHEFVVGYAKYLIEYLETILK